MQLDLVKNSALVINPSGWAPLTAALSLETNEDVFLRIRVVGKNGVASDIVHDFPMFGSVFEIPILGLYASHNNEVELSFLNANGTVIGSDNISILLGPLSSELPQIDINVPSTSTEVNLNFVNYFGYRTQAFPQRAFIFDQFGDIRWYLDYKDHPILSDLFFDYGMLQLKNGNWIFGDRNTSTLYEIDAFGEIANSWFLQGYGFHHTVIEKPDGNLLATVNDFSKPTEEDVILEIDRSSGEIVNTWDLNLSLDYSRRTWNSIYANIEVDWFHANGLAYDESDNSIIVSGRTQGVVKLSENNEVIWIIAPHKGWEASGSGQDLNNFLLDPIDQSGNVINDDAVKNGEIQHPEFGWVWYQHSPHLLPNGNLMLFDNGENRNYSSTVFYSRAVEYKINPGNKTIQQIWDYGKERGSATYSRIVSNVNYLEDKNHVLFSPGAIEFNGLMRGKVIEIDKQSQTVQFEATITAPLNFYIITFHNVHRVEMY